jgi:hypothetical protein
MNARRNKIRARRAWSGPLTLRQVAGRCGFASAGAVHQFWLREQAAGRLPAGARPFFQSCTAGHHPVASAPPTDEVSLADAGADLALDRAIERGEARDAGAVQWLAGSDPLLDRLRAVHGRDRRRRFVLRVPDDRKAPGLASPSAALALARRHDAAITAYGKQVVQEVPA